MPQTLPYGAWSSPFSARDAAATSPRRDGAFFVGDDVWWGEQVAAEGGRMAVFSRRAGLMLPAPWDAASRVHEYGGGAWAASDDGVLFFVDRRTQRVFERAPGAEPRPLTEPGDRFGGLRVQHGVLLAVRERPADAAPPRRDIVRIDGGAAPRVVSLAGGTDFVAQPALSPDGSRLAWIGWDRPHMPWDRTRLFVRELDGAGGRDGGGAARVVAGGASAALQPVWCGADELLYADDAGGRWNLCRVDAAGGPARPVAPADADTGGALWVLGQRWFDVLPDGRVVAVRTDGADEVVVIDPATGAARPLGVDASTAAGIDDVRGSRVLVHGQGVDTAPTVWLADADDAGAAQVVAGGATPWEPRWTSHPRTVVSPGPHGPVHAFDHPPVNPDATGPAGERPPYLVLVHGGPTSHAGPAASAKTTYFTSRGIGVLEVNYGGSTGYGRAYRQRLAGEWGVVDVDDTVAAATDLARAGRADPARLAVDGGSAGGWTVLSALTRTDVFAAGVSRYGVADARMLAGDTHDFEARYLDGLIGPLPDADELYRERSPLSHPDRFRVPVLLLQGADDPVVPPEQTEAIRRALAARGVPHACVVYPGEGHGFRRPETVADALEKELAFLGAVFAFAPPGVPPLSLR